MISGRTALYGVVGHPIDHSLSPQMHNAAYAHDKIDAAYVAMQVMPEKLVPAVAGAFALGFNGLNVTVPHKEAALRLCASVDRTAQEVGAINTLRRTGRGWEGYNTDAPACLALLEGAGIRTGQDGLNAIILGAGGAARAAAWAILKLGGSVRIAARRLDPAVALCQDLLKVFTKGPPRAQALGWNDVASEALRARVVVNATPIGMQGSEDELPYVEWREGLMALDFVCGDTNFLDAAKAGGATLLRGETILVRQGALAYSLWLGRPAPETVMANAIAVGVR